jgi:hypothetical protein
MDNLILITDLLDALVVDLSVLVSSSAWISKLIVGSNKAAGTAFTTVINKQNCVLEYFKDFFLTLFK